jgi:hypothetical protein
MNLSRSYVKRIENLRMRAALLLAIAVAWSTVAIAQDRLVVSRPVAREIGARDTHVYVVDLNVADRAFISVVEDGGIEATLFLPNGQALRREPPAGPDGEKDFEITAEASGSYRIELTPAAKRSAKYAIQLDGLSTAAERSSPRRASTAEELQASKPTTDDLRLLQRADELLSSRARWDRHDTRICLPSATSLSLFCALQKASLDLFGEYGHRAIALEEVRFAIEDVTDGRRFSHRLKDFNNLPSTEFRDVKTVLTIAIHRIRKRLG